MPDSASSVIAPRWWDRFRPERRHRPFRLPGNVPAVQVVGDIHGRADLLDDLLSKLDPSLPTVFLGDMIDRGPDSAGVMARLRNLESDPRVTCLMGNHEAMLLGFLDDPLRQGPRWIRGGGDATLRSLGLGPQNGAGWSDLTALAEATAQALGCETRAWLRARPLWIRIGNLLMVHAGADPALPPEDQKAETLLWGHPGSMRPRPDGLWLIHGHIVTDRLEARGGRINVDTGAWRTGRLSAACIAPPHGLRWIQIHR